MIIPIYCIYTLKKKFLIFPGKFEWLSFTTHNLTQLGLPKSSNGKNLSNMMIVVTLQDTELLKKYNFKTKAKYSSAFLPLKNFVMLICVGCSVTHDNYQLNIFFPEEVEHGISVGEKTLCTYIKVSPRNCHTKFS